MENSDALKELFEYLKKKQIKIAIDDFGTGYSSYAHIIEMPVDVLKIDKSFIDIMMQDKNALESVRAIIGMAKAIGYKILAEGVESVEQAALLQKEGCEYYQGFLKGKPMQVAEFEAQFLG
jgi:EAL domain-containing protein (putative c-di-GMP-specific phosphodiesterase class I)